MFDAFDQADAAFAGSGAWAGRAEFTVDPEQDDVTLEELPLDAAAFAEQLGLAAVAARLR